MSVALLTCGHQPNVMRGVHHSLGDLALQWPIDEFAVIAASTH